MERYQKELTHIKELLKDNPRGMTVIEISKAININRNSVAKYLDILLISGHVEMKTVGPAKLFFLSQRVPISALLNFSSDYILVLDHNLKITQVNENLLEFIQLEHKTILGQKIEKSTFPFFTDPEINVAIKEALKGKNFTSELVFQRMGEQVYFRMKILPTTFDDGRRGVIILLENITEAKKADKALEWEVNVNAAMTELASTLIQSASIDDIAYLVLEYGKQLTGSRFGYVSYIDPQTGYNVGVTLTRDIWETCEVPGKDIVFKEFQGLWGWVLEHRQSLLTNNPADDPRSIGVPSGHIPIQRFLSVPAMIGDKLMGQIALANSNRDYKERDLKLVEKLAVLYALAIQRMQTESALYAEREMVQQYLDAAAVMIIALDTDAKVILMNTKGCEILGYKKAEILGKNWFENFLPERLRKEVKEVFQQLLTGQIELVDSYENPILTQSGEEKNILWRNTVLRDATGNIIGTLSTGTDTTEYK